MLRSSELSFCTSSVLYHTLLHRACRYQPIIYANARVSPMLYKAKDDDAANSITPSLNSRPEIGSVTLNPRHRLRD